MMLRRTILGTMAAVTATGIVAVLDQIVRGFAVADWLREGHPSAPAVAGVFAVVLIAVGGADLVRLLVKAATRSAPMLRAD